MVPILRPESITTGVPELPQVLAMAALKVATSVLLVTDVDPGAVGSPTQFAAVDQVPLAVEPPSQVWLAANTLDDASAKTTMAAARFLTNRAHFFRARLQETKHGRRTAERGRNRLRRVFIIWGSGFIGECLRGNFLNIKQKFLISTDKYKSNMQHCNARQF